MTLRPVYRPLMLFLTFLCFGMTVALPAAEFGQLVYEVVNDEIQITGCNDHLAEEIEIPDAIDGFPVTVIGEFAFENHLQIKKVIFPNGLLTIGRNSFDFCFNLESADLPEGLLQIDSAAFSFCQRIKIIETPTSLLKIGTNAFSDCQRLERVILDGNKLVIEDDAFKRCSSLKYVTIKGGVMRVSDGVFSWSHSIESIDIHEGLESLGLWGIAFGDKIKNFELPSTLLKIKGGAFNTSKIEQINVHPDNPSYVSIDGVLFSRDRKLLHSYPTSRSGFYEIPDGVIDIGEKAFGSCSLQSIKLSPTVRVIGDWAFQGCVYLSEIDLNDGLISIGRQTFNSPILSAVKIPESVTKIGSGAFFACKNLDYIRITSPVIEIGNNVFPRKSNNRTSRHFKEVIIPIQFHDPDESSRIGLGKSSRYFKTPQYADADNLQIFSGFYGGSRRMHVQIICHTADSQIDKVLIESSMHPDGPWVYFAEAKIEDRVGYANIEDFDQRAQFFRQVHSN